MKLQYKPSRIEPGSVEWDKCKAYALVQVGSCATNVSNAETLLDSAEDAMTCES